MKICIPKSEAKVTRHFGKAPEFAFFTVEDDEIIATETVPNPGREKVDVPIYVADFNVTHVIASGIGDKAIGMLHGRSIVGVQRCRRQRGHGDGSVPEGRAQAPQDQPG